MSYHKNAYVCVCMRACVCVHVCVYVRTCVRLEWSLGTRFCALQILQLLLYLISSECHWAGSRQWVLLKGDSKQRHQLATKQKKEDEHYLFICWF